MLLDSTMLCYAILYYSDLRGEARLPAALEVAHVPPHSPLVRTPLHAAHMGARQAAARPTLGEGGAIVAATPEAAAAAAAAAAASARCAAGSVIVARWRWRLF